MVTLYAWLGQETTMSVRLRLQLLNSWLSQQTTMTTWLLNLMVESTKDNDHWATQSYG